MRVEMSCISKACVNPYRGAEIPDSTALGLKPDKVYRLYRHPDELAKAASTFDGKPLLIKHVPVTAELPQQELWVGTIGACTFEPPYLVTRPLTVITAEAQDLIESEEQRELSAGYRYRADMTPGQTPEGEPYDGVMREIQGNHVAIVREGRAGPDVHVADELPLELKSMKHRKLIAALTKKVPAIAKLSATELLALDEGLGEVPAKSVVTLDEKEEKAAVDAALDAKRKSHGKDAELSDEEREEALEKARDKKARDAAAKDAKAADKAARDKKAKDGVSGHRPANDAAADEAEEAADAAECAADEKEEAEDEEKDDDEAKDRRRARDRRMGARDARKAARDSRKAARDAASDPNDHRRDFRSGDRAKDAALTMDQVDKLVSKAVARETEKVRQEVTAQQRALAVAIDEVAPIAGRVELHAFDSAEEVYEFALEKAGVEIEADFPKAGLRKLVEIELKHRQAPRRSPTHAADSAPKDYDFQGIMQRVEH